MLMEQRDPGPKGTTEGRRNASASTRTHFLRDNPGIWFVWSTAGASGNVRSGLNCADPDGEYEVARRGHESFVRYIGRKGEQ